MTQRVLIVGSVAMDDITTPEVAHKGLLGGSAVYGSVAASRFSPVDIVGVAGDDFPDEYIRDLNAMGVDTGGLEIVAGGKTFHWAGEYKGEMNEAITHQTDLGVFGEFSPAIPVGYQADDYVFLANIDPELQLTVLDQVASPKLTVLDSMNLWINIKREKLIEVLSRVDVAILNDAEVRMLFDTPSLPTAAQGLLDLGLKRAIIKKGSNGAQMFSAEGTFAVPAIPLQNVTDPTGAGDTFAGGLIGYLAARDAIDEMTFRQAVVVGSACASYVVEDFSIGRTSKLDKAQIQERCDRILCAMRCDAIKL